jgi:predicted lactoylglutathione lyase
LVRAHRQALAHVKSVCELKWTREGNMVAVLTSGSSVQVSRRRRAAFRQIVLALLQTTGDPMLTHFPQAVPEIPVSSVDKAAGYYVNVLGFSFDWGNDDGGIGGISQGDCRMFLTNAPFRAIHGPKGPVIVWLNLNSKQEVDALFERWKDTGAKIIEAVEDKPWNLREFRVADLDGNQLRVFYDLNWEMSEERRR